MGPYNEAQNATARSEIQQHSGTIESEGWSPSQLEQFLS